jgi:hypothetical protein
MEVLVQITAKNVFFSILLPSRRYMINPQNKNGELSRR